MLQLNLDLRSGEHTAVVRCSGRIVFHQEVRMLSNMVRPLLENHERVILDLGQVRDVDSAGLGTLASLHSFAREQDHSFALMNPAASVRDLLELTHLDRHLQVLSGDHSSMKCAA